MINKYKNFMLILISSFFVFLSYPKYSLSPLAFISLIPYILVIFEIKNKNEALKYGFIYGFFTYILLLYWIYFTMRAADVNVFFSALSVLLLSSLLSIEFIIITVVSYFTKNCSSKLLIFILPSIWVVIDFIKVEITKYIPYFPWFMFFYSQWNNPYILNLIHILGSYFITFLIVFINILIALIFLDKTKIGKTKKLIYVILILTLTLILGRKEYLSISKYLNNPTKRIRVALIQPSIDFYKKWDINYVEEIKSDIENLLKNVSLKKPDIIIWPENALYGWIDDKDVFEWLCKNIKKTQTYHIVGSVSRLNRKHVSAYLINPDCKIIGNYNKRVLVPFGEYVPLRNIFGKFINVVTTLGEFEPGSFRQEPFNLNNIYILQTICYETAFNYLFQSDKKISFIVNITNDGWYLNTSAPYQHFAISIIRAVEFKKPLIRAANNGISAVIYPNGIIKSYLNLNEYNYIVEDIPLHENNFLDNTFIKNIIVSISFLIILAFILAIIFRR